MTQFLDVQKIELSYGTRPAAKEDREVSLPTSGDFFILLHGHSKVREHSHSSLYSRVGHMQGVQLRHTSYTGCWLCVDAELAIGLGVHGTCGLNNPWHHLRKMSSWVGNPGRPPYVIPRGSAGLKKMTD